MTCTIYLNGLKKTWAVSELLLVSVLQGMCYMYLYTFKTLLLISLITRRKSASCTHISALLHELAVLTSIPFPVASSVPDDEDAESVSCNITPMSVETT